MNVVKEINKLNEKELNMDVDLNVSWHERYKDSAFIFVGGMDYELTEGDIVAVFAQYGEIIHINLVRDKVSGKSKGFAFICYEDQRSTICAVDNFNGTTICGRTIRVDHVVKYKPPKVEPEELEKLKKEKEKQEQKELKKKAKQDIKNAAKEAKRAIKNAKKEKRNEEKRKKKEAEDKELEKEMTKLRGEEERRKREEDDEGKKNARTDIEKYDFASNWNFRPKEKRWEDMTERERFFAEQEKIAPRSWNTPRDFLSNKPAPPEPEIKKKRPIEDGDANQKKKVVKISGIKLGPVVPKVEKKKKDALDYLEGERPPEDNGKSEDVDIVEMNKLRASFGMKPLSMKK